MTDLARAVVGYLRSMADKGLLAARPVRVDGFSRSEIDMVVPAVESIAGEGVVRILAPANAESRREVNAERATRYRNVYGAPGAPGPFVLFVPQGQVVESSLDEPAFALVHRATIFQVALMGLRDRLGLKAVDIEGVRETARFRNAEALYAFLEGLETDGSIDAFASYRQLGLLGDSRIPAAGDDVSEIRSHLRENWAALEILLRPGQAPGRMLDELITKVGLVPETSGQDVLELVQWWHSGSKGQAPRALDFALWDRTTMFPSTLGFEANLSLPPHKGWTDGDGTVVLEDAAKPCTIAWVIKGQRPGLKVELELVEETTQATLRSLGTAASNSKKITLDKLLKSYMSELKELNPQGDFEGYPLMIRARLLDGKRRLDEVESLPFVVRLDPGPASQDMTVAAAGTAYQALYQYHAELKAESPWVQRRNVEIPAGSVYLKTHDGRAKVAALDISSELLALEARLLQRPDLLGPWRWTPSGALDDLELVATTNLGHLITQGERYREFMRARGEFFQLVRDDGCVEGTDPIDTRDVRPALERYLKAFRAAVDGLAEPAERQSGVPQASRDEALLLSGLDTIEVVLDQPGGASVLLVPPTTPAAAAWMLGLAETLSHWARGRHDGISKPPYKGWVESLSAGPRSMVLGTMQGDAKSRWWVYAGNLTSAWSCYLPEGVKAGDIAGWVDRLSAIVGLSPKALGLGATDALRVGGRVKKFAVTHPYVDQLQIAAVTDSSGKDLLDALKVVDEKPGTPAGAQSVRNIRYEITVIGPATPELGRAIDEMTLNPGDAQWRRHAEAILDNPETVLVPGFAYARRTVREGDNYWAGVRDALAEHDPDGLHIAMIGSVLDAKVGVVSAKPEDRGLQAGGLVARPVMRLLQGGQTDPLMGTWLVGISDTTAADGTLTQRTASALGRALTLARGVHESSPVLGLEVSLSGGRSLALREALKVADWLMVTDPLFAVELLDRRMKDDAGALLLDYTPEFEPFPGGRVVVATRSIEEVSEFGEHFGGLLKITREITPVLASISARLLLSLSNPTKQVVGGLSGLALTRVLIAEERPGALVIPVDGHEDMFAISKRNRANMKADLLVVEIHHGRLYLDVVESKWSENSVGPMLAGGAEQARHTQLILREDYIDYTGVDRAFRLENLREVILFHLARAKRHDVQPSFIASDVMDAFADPAQISTVMIGSRVVGWSMGGADEDSDTANEEGTVITYRGRSSVGRYAARMREWPSLAGGSSTAAAEPVTDVVPTGPEQAPASAPAHEAVLPSGWEELTAEASEEPEVLTPVADLPPAPAIEMVPAVEPPSAPGSEVPAVSTVSAAVAVQPQPASAPPLDRNCVLLGSVVNPPKPATWCPPLLSNGHLVLIGGSGAGKTTALRHITHELRQVPVPVLVLDFHGDIEAVDDSERLYQFDYQGNSVFVNPFHVDTRYASQLTPTRLKWEFIEAWKSHYSSLGVQQINYLARLIDEAYANAGMTSNPSTWTRQIDFGWVLDAFDASEESEAFKSRIVAYMTRFREWQVFHGGEEIAVESFLETSTRLDLSQLDETARNIVADIVLRRLFLLVKALGHIPSDAKGWDKFRVFVVIDEAQLLMKGAADAKASLAKYTAEARKFGIGLILATQLRDNVPGDLWGNIDTRLFMQALDQNERMRNAKAAGVDEHRLGSLLRGQAILVQSSQPHLRPVTIQIQPSWIKG